MFYNAKEKPADLNRVLQNNFVFQVTLVLLNMLLTTCRQYRCIIYDQPWTKSALINFNLSTISPADATITRACPP
jgi:hypothetical protein